MSRSGADLGGLHVIADDDPRWPWGPLDQARAACAGGANVVQLRVKHGTDRAALALGEALRRITREAQVLFFVNDRFDLALACGADGVHLGQGDLPPGALPAAVRDRLLIGRSTHDLAEATRARAETIDYLALGPIFGSASKPSAGTARGLALLGEVSRLAAPLPVIAIGGVGPANAGSVRSAGAGGAAVISAVAAAEDPLAATRALVAALAGEPG